MLPARRPQHVVREDSACRRSLLALEAHGGPGLALHHCLFVHVRMSSLISSSFAVSLKHTQELVEVLKKAQSVRGQLMSFK